MDKNMSLKEKALYYQKLMKTYSDRAEKNSREIIDSLRVDIPKIYETIPSRGIMNRIKRFYFRTLEEELD